MLQAKSNNGNLVVLATLTRQEVADLKKKESFFCPVCENEVIIKVGTKITPHFAHRSKQDCPSNNHGEGPYHEQGKFLLYQWLKKQGFLVQLEVYIKEINQRPDLFVTIDHRLIAIEFQCARTNISQIQQRNNGYHQAGIIPIWILGANNFQRYSSHSIKVDEFTKQFIHQFSPTCLPSLYYFCPHTRQFVFFQDIYFTRHGRAIGKLQFIPVQQTSFKKLFHYQSLPELTLYQLWKKEKKSFRLTHPKRIFGQEKLWYEWLYHRGTHRELLPSIVFLPVLMQVQMKTPLWNWQSRLCVDMIHWISVGSQFSLQICQQFIQPHLESKTKYPLIHPNETAIKEYLLLLEKLHVVKQIAPNQFIKQNKIKFHKHIEDALKSDNILISEIIRNS